MQLGGKPPKKSSNLFDDDFASGFEDSKFDKFKPALKVLGVIVLLAGLGVGSLYYFDNKSDDSSSSYSQTDMSDDAKIIDEALSKKAELSQKFSACTSKASNEGSDLSTADPDFNKKLIGSYDNWLACYDQYPEAAANASPSRSSLELARQGAIDNSGSYKDTYLSSNSYDYTPSTYTPTYDPSKYESTYTPEATAPASSDPTTTSPYTPPPSSGSSDSSSSQAAADRSYQLSKCQQQVRQSTGGTGLTQSQRDQMVDRCMRDHGY